MPAPRTLHPTTFLARCSGPHALLRLVLTPPVLIFAHIAHIACVAAHTQLCDSLLTLPHPVLHPTAFSSWPHAPLSLVSPSHASGPQGALSATQLCDSLVVFSIHSYPPITRTSHHAAFLSWLQLAACTADFGASIARLWAIRRIAHTQRAAFSKWQAAVRETREGRADWMLLCRWVITGTAKGAAIFKLFKLCACCRLIT